MFRARGWRSLVFSCSVALLGCSESHSDDESLVPPPPPPKQVAQQTYDYTHTARNAGRTRLSRKFVVSLIRFAPDRAPDDPTVPYGEGPVSGTPSEKGNQVVVNVQKAPAWPPGSSEMAVGMSPRDRAFLKQSLMESGSFVVVERERILDLIREQNLGKTSYVNPATAVNSGELMGVQYLIEASVGENLDATLKDTEPPPPSYKDGETPLFDKLFKPGAVNARQRFEAMRLALYRDLKQWHKQELNRCGAYLSMYSVRTGELVADAFGLGGNSLLAIEDAVEDLVDKCLEIPNPPRIAAVRGERVFLDLGENDRVQIGQKLRYLTPGEEIRNRSGRVIGRTDEEGGELEIVKVEPLMSIAKVTRRLADPVVGGIIEPLD